MSRLSDDSPSWASQPESEELIRELREQLGMAKARLGEHREKARAIGLRSPSDQEHPEA